MRLWRCVKLFIQRSLEEAEKQIAHLAAMVVGQSDTDRTVAARSFVLKDERGLVRATLGMQPNEEGFEGSPCLGLFDVDGNARLTVSGGTSEGGPAMLLRDANTNAKLTLGFLSSGKPLVWMHDANGKLRAALTVDQEGPRLQLCDPEEKVAAGIFQAEFGGTGMHFFHAKGEPGVTVSVIPDYGAVVRLSDANGKPRLNLVVSRLGVAELFMGEFGPTEAQPFVGPSLSLAVKSTGPFLVFGRDNKVFWSAP